MRKNLCKTVLMTISCSDDKNMKYNSQMQVILFSNYFPVESWRREEKINIRIIFNITAVVRKSFFVGQDWWESIDSNIDI